MFQLELGYFLLMMSSDVSRPEDINVPPVDAFLKKSSSEVSLPSQENDLVKKWSELNQEEKNK